MKVDDKLWTTTEVHRLFQIGEKLKSEKSLAYAEEKGLIPKANRIKRGKIQVRQWSVDQLPEIGNHFGFLRKPSKKLVACVYTSKGGVLKTTFSHNFARVSALNGIRTLIIDLDTIQESLTNIVFPPQIDTLEQLDQEIPGLYHYFFERHPLDQIIRKTSIPTLDIIPATPELAQLEIKLSTSARREYFFTEKLIDHLDYELIIFDNGHGWNPLVMNSLTASNNVICPMGCSILAYRAVNKNVSFILDFEKAMKLKWDNFIQIPTILERNKFSNQIFASYLAQYRNTILPTPIRNLVTGQEATAFNISVIEYDATSPLAQDYYNVISSVWSRMNGYEEI